MRNLPGGLWGTSTGPPRKVPAFNKQRGTGTTREHFSIAVKILGVEGPRAFSESDFASLGCFSGCCLATPPEGCCLCTVNLSSKAFPPEKPAQEFQLCCDAGDHFFLHISLQLPFLLSIHVCYGFLLLTFSCISGSVFYHF